ncbi:MAG: peptidylprolyl isomerase [Novosphingobium sp.]
MHKTSIMLAALLTASASALFGQASANVAAGRTTPSPLAPSEIVAAAPKGDWTAIPASDLLVMDLAPDARGKQRRVVIQLMPPPFSQGWIGNVRLLAKAHWWDGTAVNRVQDNYVVQWGDPNAEDKAKAKPLPPGLVTVPEREYETDIPASLGTFGLMPQLPAGWDGIPSPYLSDGRVLFDDKVNGAFETYFGGFPIAGNRSPHASLSWPIHCYGMVGVGRDLSPNTGSGAELYTVIGHAPRHLDRNIALVGRVIEGIENLSGLPRGHGVLGFYDLKQGDRRVPIRSIRPGTDVKALPAYEYLSTESRSFSKYAVARANRRDAFFIRPAGGADICNIPVPVRRVT